MADRSRPPSLIEKDGKNQGRDVGRDARHAESVVLRRQDTQARRYRCRGSEDGVRCSTASAPAPPSRDFRSSWRIGDLHVRRVCRRPHRRGPSCRGRGSRSPAPRSRNRSSPNWSMLGEGETLTEEGRGQRDGRGVGARDAVGTEHHVQLGNDGRSSRLGSVTVRGTPGTRSDPGSARRRVVAGATEAPSGRGSHSCCPTPEAQDGTLRRSRSRHAERDPRSRWPPCGGKARLVGRSTEVRGEVRTHRVPRRVAAEGLDGAHGGAADEVLAVGRRRPPTSQPPVPANAAARRGDAAAAVEAAAGSMKSRKATMAGTVKSSLNRLAHR